MGIINEKDLYLITNVCKEGGQASWSNYYVSHIVVDLWDSMKNICKKKEVKHLEAIIKGSWVRQKYNIKEDGYLINIKATIISYIIIEKDGEP